MPQQSDVWFAWYACWVFNWPIKVLGLYIHLDQPCENEHLAKLVLRRGPWCFPLSWVNLPPIYFHQQSHFQRWVRRFKRPFQVYVLCYVWQTRYLLNLCSGIFDPIHRRHEHPDWDGQRGCRRIRQEKGWPEIQRVWQVPDWHEQKSQGCWNHAWADHRLHHQLFLPSVLQDVQQKGGYERYASSSQRISLLVLCFGFIRRHWKN